MGIGEADRSIRLAAFEWLTQRREERGEAIARSALEAFELGGVRVPLVGPSGIWKPAVCELPISVATVVAGPYPDAFDPTKGQLRYSYRGTDPSHRDNVGLRRAMRERVPLIYFHAVSRGPYAAAYPVFVVADDPSHLTFSMQVDDMSASIEAGTFVDNDIPDDPAIRRAYVTRSFRQRLHQVAFRQRVIQAYRERCALCRLGHQQLLDAAHITPDRDEEGEPLVSNGLALCKLHHAAFDNFFFAIRPDYVIEVRPSILAESDGPMLVVGLQEIHGRSIGLPIRTVDRPDVARLERRYGDFIRLAS